MKNLSAKTSFLLALILVASSFSFQVLSQKKSKKASSASGIKLVYNFPADKFLSYYTDSKIVQDMDINGSSMLVNISTYMGCQVKSAGKQGDNLKLEIKMDSLSQFVESPQGAAGGAVTDIKGKTFNLVISPEGKTEDFSEAEKIVYNVEGSGEATLAQSFMNYFPVLPVDPIKVGDTWITNDTIQTKTETMSLWMPVRSEYKFDGIMTVDGLECAKISAAVSGTRKMTTQSQGMEIKTSGTYTGTQLLIFAIKEGYFTKESVNSKMTGNIEVADQNMVFPVVMDIATTNEIIR